MIFLKQTTYFMIVNTDSVPAIRKNAVEITDRIISAMDKNKIPLNIYFDLSKAFDTLDHAILLDKYFIMGFGEIR